MVSFEQFTVQELKKIIRAYNLHTKITMSKDKKAKTKPELIDDIKKHLRFDENDKLVFIVEVKEIEYPKQIEQPKKEEPKKEEPKKEVKKEEPKKEEDENKKIKDLIDYINEKYQNKLKFKFGYAEFQEKLNKILGNDIILTLYKQIDKNEYFYKLSQNKIFTQYYKKMPSYSEIQKQLINNKDKLKNKKIFEIQRNTEKINDEELNEILNNNKFLKGDDGYVVNSFIGINGDGENAKFDKIDKILNKKEFIKLLEKQIEQKKDVNDKFKTPEQVDFHHKIFSFDSIKFNKKEVAPNKEIWEKNFSYGDSKTFRVLVGGRSLEEIDEKLSKDFNKFIKIYDGKATNGQYTDIKFNKYFYNDVQFKEILYRFFSHFPNLIKVVEYGGYKTTSYNKDRYKDLEELYYLIPEGEKEINKIYKDPKIDIHEYVVNLYKQDLKK